MAVTAFLVSASVSPFLAREATHSGTFARFVKSLMGMK
jgi:hypothetical protein